MITMLHLLAQPHSSIPQLLKFDYRFVDELFVFYRQMGFFPYQPVDLFCFYVGLFSVSGDVFFPI
jgi:hypothetical protein